MWLSLLIGPLALLLAAYLWLHQEARRSSGADAWTLSFNIALVYAVFPLLGAVGGALILRGHREGVVLLLSNILPIAFIVRNGENPLSVLYLPFLVNFIAGVATLFNRTS